MPELTLTPLAPERLIDGCAVWLRAVDDAAATPGERATLVARDADGRALGSVAYARVYGPRAELSLEVDAALWHRGLPELLVAGACASAARFGISTFLARVPAADVRLLALLRERFAARESRDGATVAVEFATRRR
ncbi:MAG: hypothetical protein QOG94_1451 [Solirubrobacteraceae bacterium]|nr:hypothetical protein [Solirubrobacteraceae bacterium]MEA2138810.1 hypothetical protein [Solirubrobacteraceae bacterium]